MAAGERKSPTTIQYDEHDAVLYAKKTSLVSAATIYAVVNSGTGGTSSTDDAVFNVAVDAGTPFMALADDTSPDSVDEGDVGVVRMTLNRWLETKMESAATIFAVVNTSAQGQASVVLDASIQKIGFATVNVANTVPVTFSGNVTLDDGSLTGIVGNVTLSDSKTYIGLVTTTPASNITLNASAAFIGLVSVSGFANPLPVTFSGNVTLDDGSLTGIVGNVTLSDAKTYIGLVTATPASPTTVTHAGLVTLAPLSNIGFATVNVVNIARTITGNVTLSDAKTYIGLVTNTPVGLSTVIQGTSPWSSSIVGNVTLSDAKTFIGLVTTIYAPPPISTYTSFATIFSTTGNLSLFAPPAGKRFVIKDLHISSLGRAEVNIKNGDKQLIPYTSLSTTSGIAAHYGESGLAAEAADDIFALTLNGAATVAIMVNVRFE